MHNSKSNSNQECFQQKSDSKCKDSFTVDGSGEHETYVVGSTTVACKSCYCSNGKIAKMSNEENGVEYSPPPGVGFSFTCCHTPLSHHADEFQMHFVDPKLIHRVGSRMQDYTQINPPMELEAAGHNTLFGTARGILLVVVHDTKDVGRTIKLPIVLVPGLEWSLFWAMAKRGSSRCFFGQKRMYLKTIAVESVVGHI